MPAPTLLARYDAALAEGNLRPDPAQRAVAERLQTLLLDLAKRPHAPGRGRKDGWLGRILGRHDKTAPLAPGQKAGIYLHGPVGRGKTMLVDRMIAAAPAGLDVKRVHFHAFMTSVHNRLHTLRRGKCGDDAVDCLVNELAAEQRLLALDEFQVHDIVDAMILARLFTGLIERGVVCVFTSNTPPSKLYWDGLQRDRFLPFIQLIEQRFDVLALDGGRDWRRQRLSGQPVWFTGPDRSQRLSEAWSVLTDGGEMTPDSIPLPCRRRIPLQGLQHGVAWASFDALCRQPLGAADYAVLAGTVGTLILAEIPCLKAAERDAALRFIHLVDVLYEAHTVLVVSAAAAPESLVPADSAFAERFQRTVSRLIEMGSANWLGDRLAEPPPTREAA